MTTGQGVEVLVPLHAEAVWPGKNPVRGADRPVSNSPSRSLAICGRVCTPCCLSPVGMGNDDGVSPRQAPVTIGVGAVVGDGDVPGFGSAIVIAPPDSSPAVPGTRRAGKLVDVRRGFSNLAYWSAAASEVASTSG